MHITSIVAEESGINSPVCLEESSAARFIGLLPILSHAQNAAKHTVAGALLRSRTCTCVYTYIHTYVYARSEPDNEALPPR